jgi:hypothetical protein
MQMNFFTTRSKPRAKHCRVNSSSGFCFFADDLSDINLSGSVTMSNDLQKQRLTGKQVNNKDDDGQDRGENEDEVRVFLCPLYKCENTKQIQSIFCRRPE